MNGSRSMRAVKAGLAPPFLGRGEEVLKESGPRWTRAMGDQSAPIPEEGTSELGGTILGAWSPYLERNGESTERNRSRGRQDVRLQNPPLNRLAGCNQTVGGLFSQLRRAICVKLQSSQ